MQVISTNIVISEKGLKASSWRQCSDCRSQYTLGEISPHLCWLMCTADELTWWFQVRCAVHKATHFGEPHAKLLTQEGETKGLCASLASQGHSRTTLITFRFSVIWSNLFLPHGWVSWSRAGVDYRRGDELEENRYPKRIKLSHDQFHRWPCLSWASKLDWSRLICWTGFMKSL